MQGSHHQDDLLKPKNFFYTIDILAEPWYTPYTRRLRVRYYP